MKQAKYTYTWYKSTIYKPTPPTIIFSPKHYIICRDLSYIIFNLTNIFSPKLNTIKMIEDFYADEICSANYEGMYFD